MSTEKIPHVIFVYINIKNLFNEKRTNEAVMSESALKRFK
jgi:hypothetical protein